MISQKRSAVRRASLIKRSVLVATALIGGFGGILSVTTVARADSAPDPLQVEMAQRTSELMRKTVFAALLQEFAETTPENVEEGKKSISLIFNDRNEDMRLVGTQQPLRANDIPQDPFESTALSLAMQGQPWMEVQKVEGKWYFRRSIPVSNFDPSCSMCHTNFGAPNPAQWVGALMLRVPVTDRNKD